MEDKKETSEEKEPVVVDKGFRLSEGNKETGTIRLNEGFKK